MARTLLIGFLCLLLAPAPAGAVPAGRAGQRQPSYSELKREATRAAERYSRAQAGVARLGNEVARLEQELEDLKARMVPLRDVVTRRAVAVYMGSRDLDALSTLEGDPVALARRARLVSEVSAVDVDTMAALAASVAEAHERREALGAKLQEQQAALAELERDQRDVEAKLAIMVRRGRELQSRVVRQQRAARSQGRVPAPVEGDIPVLTNFICPIRGPVAFTDSWGDPRSGGRRHRGTDLMSPRGTDNVAVVSGHMRRHHSAAGGLSIYLTGDDGNTYFYAHLSEVIGPDRRVAQGEVIGKTGNSGNARGSSPHTHFEIHPGGGAAINPYPILAAHC